MNKTKSTILLSIISVIMAVALVFTFLRFNYDGGVKKYNSAIGAIELDYDIEGGVAYTLELRDDNYDEVGEDEIAEILKTFNYRLEKLGYKAFSVKALKSTEAGVEDYVVRIETKNTDSISEDIETVFKYGEVKVYGGTDSANLSVICEGEEVIKSADYTGAVTSGDSTAYGLKVQFTKNAYKTIVDAIESAEGSYYMDIKFVTEENGAETEESLFDNGGEPIVKDYFEKQSLTAYLNNEAEAERRALLIGEGGLSYKYQIAEESPVLIESPSSEKNAAVMCLISVITITVVFAALMILMYRGLGVITSLSSLFFILGETWLMIGVPGITFSFGGLIGMVLSSFVCAFCMAILAKRVKEEFANTEKTAMAAIKKGFNKSIAPTAGIHIVAGVTALLLLAFTTGVVQCFAITFGIGIAVSLIVTLGFTRMYSALILPLVDDKEKFLRFKRAQVVEEGEVE